MDVVVARIGKPHSLKGEVTVRLHTDEPGTRLVPGATFRTEAASGSGVPHELTVHSVRVHNGTWLLAFDGIADRTGAESLRGTRLMTTSQAPATRDARAADAQAGDAADAQAGDAADAWYEDQLVGLEVLTQVGTRLGTVSGLEIGAAQDLLLVALESGGTAYLPFVRAIVPTVDVAAGRVVVDPPGGLLDLNT